MKDSHFFTETIFLDESIESSRRIVRSLSRINEFLFEYENDTLNCFTFKYQVKNKVEIWLESQGLKSTKINIVVPVNKRLRFLKDKIAANIIMNTESAIMLAAENRHEDFRRLNDKLNSIGYILIVIVMMALALAILYVVKIIVSN